MITNEIDRHSAVFPVLHNDITSWTFISLLIGPMSCRHREMLPFKTADVDQSLWSRRRMHDY